MANVYEAFSLGDRTLTGKVIGNLTIDFCKTMAGAAVSQAGMTLTELGVGKYVLMNPNITERTIISGYLTADDSKSFSVVMDPADGDIARQSSLVALPAAADIVSAVEASTVLALETTSQQIGAAVVALGSPLQYTDARVPATVIASQADVASVAATLAAGVTVNPAQFGAGVLQGKVTVTNGETIRRTRGDFIPQGTISFAFGSDWDCTARDLYFCVRAGSVTAPTGPKLLDLTCVLIDAATATGTLPDMDLEDVLLPASDGYVYEFESVLTADGTKPLTIRRGKFILDQDVRNS